MTTPSDIEAELRDLATYFIGYAWSAFDNKKPEMVVDKFKELLHQYAEKRELEARTDEVMRYAKMLREKYDKELPPSVYLDFGDRLAQLKPQQEEGK